MTLEEFEKIREEKRKALLALKTEERKVEVDRDLQSMQPLANKKGNDEFFVKLVSRHYALIFSALIISWRCPSLIIIFLAGF